MPKSFPISKSKSITLPCAILLTSISLAFSQTVPVKEWDKTFGGTKTDEMYVIIQTSDGGYLLGGDSDSPISGQKSQGSQGYSDYWIVKTDALGNKQWDKRFGGNSKDELFTLIQTPDKGYILGGWTLSGVNGDQTNVSRGGSDYWVIKVDENGNKIWDKRYGGPGDDELRSMSITSDGGFIMAGESKSGIGSEKSQPNHGEFDVWVIKTDAAGNKQWDASYGGLLDDRLNAIQQTSDGGYIIGAWTISPVGFDVTKPGRGSSDMWLVKTDANGVKLWDGRYGGNDNEYLYALDQTYDGGFILGGYTRSNVNGEVTIPGKGGFDFWIVKTDGNGIKLWDKRYGGTLDEKGKSIFQTVDGGFIMGGWSESPISGDKTQNTQGATDYWLVRMDADGNKIWDLDFGATNEERLHDVPQTSDGGFIVAGHSYSGKSGDKSEASNGIDDYWIVKLSSEVTNTTFYADADGDGFGDATSDTLAVTAPPGYVTNSSDCNDTNAAINPNAVETCNGGIDDNCNGLADDADSNVTGRITYYVDNDQDGYGSGVAQRACIPPAGTALQNDDCNNNNAAIHPGALDVCNGIDDNCDFIIDENPLPVPLVKPSGTIVACSGADVLLTTTFDPSYSYQWYKTKIIQTGATNNTFTTSKSGSFLVKVSTVPGCEASSAATTINRVNKPDAQITPLGNLDICGTGTVDLQANAGTGLSYQWKNESGLISGATNIVYSATTKGNYRVIVTNEASCSKTSPIVKVTTSCKETGPVALKAASEISIYPNPAHDHLMIAVKFQEAINENASIELVDLMGRIIQSFIAPVADGSLLYELALTENVLPGTYLVKVLMSDHLLIRTVVLQ